jgi:feruloyl-CoA synthase
MGDALLFVDEKEPAKGFVFDGRITEDFKLATGTWVSVGPLRARFLSHCAPFAQDVVIAGENRSSVGVLIFPNRDACKREGTEADVRALFKKLLEDFSRTSTGSSNLIASAILLDEPPSIDAHEVTDKGSLNQRAILANRRLLVEELYVPSPRTIVIDKLDLRSR